MVILLSFVDANMKILPKIWYKHFVLDRTIFSQDPYFPKIMFIYKINGNTNIINQDVQKEHVYIPDFFLIN